LARDLWGKIAGMKNEKEMLERRLVLPLADSRLAETFGVEPPKAIVLFGPPGTGKTTFAKAVASRLDWPFIEVFPSRLAGDPSGLAGGLREVFNTVNELENVVVFIDEVEEIASKRKGDPPSPTQGVTNELLKLIPAFREKPGHLLVVATNYIRVIPIGLPDEEARRSIWGRYIPATALPNIDLNELVSRSAGFSPADIEYAARKASQRALEQSVYEAQADTNESSTTATHHYLWAIGDTRRTVSDEIIGEFEQDIKSVGRLWVTGLSSPLNLQYRVPRGDRLELGQLTTSNFDADADRPWHFGSWVLSQVSWTADSDPCQTRALLAFAGHFDQLTCPMVSA